MVRAATSANDSTTPRRKLAAIFAADVAGYSRLMADNEEKTTAELVAQRKIMDAVIKKYGGRIANTAGDSVLAEFESSVEAVRCAVEVQEALRSRVEGAPDHCAFQFRIGINVGDVIVQGADLLGDGVNIASRLEAIAEPGGICISRQVREQIEGKLTLQIVPMGKQKLKNLPHPVQTFKVGGKAHSGNVLERTRSFLFDFRAQFKFVLGAISLAVIIIFGFLFVQQTNTGLKLPDNPLLGLPPSPVTDQNYSQSALDEWASFSISSREIVEEREFNGTRYVLVKAWGIKWVEAEAEARALGGQLVSIASQEVNDLLVNMIAERDDVWRKREDEGGWQRFGPWIGLFQSEFDQEPDGGWVWSNGEKLTYSNWFWHQPDNWDGVEHFGRFREFSDQDGIRWDDGRFDTIARGYLVEFK
ncbi:Adenylate cyclase, class 3 [Ruegeria halocynthiae]|uniref:Adenylate cyclase, class 3 n=1 Tax=Ruegeria halocynthiae TaxID=985054 RepID=A0A1H3EX00_9RHOB|nr:adenylate/guanylate cyclase domain-containing protein [Ruegeria halocynthiae]SDX83353.1 Adenylate cyclase, class 3 [Ruegeria halocynthiae]